MSQTHHVATGLSTAALGTLLVLVYIAIMALLVWAYRRKRKQMATIHDHPAEVVEMRNALLHWLHDERIVKAMVQTGTATLLELQATLLLVPAMSKAQLAGAVQSLLRLKDVRRVIAVQIMKLNPGAGPKDHANLLKGLTEWANPVPERRRA